MQSKKLGKNNFLRMLAVCFFSLPVLCLLFIPIHPQPYYELFISALWPLGHVVLFGALTIGLLLWSEPVKSLSGLIQLVVIMVVTITLGIITELIQPYFNRSAQFDDLLMNMVGAILAWVFFSRAIPQGILLRVSQFFSLIFLCYLLKPVYLVSLDHFHGLQIFPKLVDFNSPTQLLRWHADQPVYIYPKHDLPAIGHISDGAVEGNVMAVTLVNRKYTGAALRVFEGNWNGFDFLKVNIFNPNPQILKLRMIITDVHYKKNKPNSNDRFNQWLVSEPGWNQFEINLQTIRDSLKNREMDISAIRGVDFYAYGIEIPKVIYLGEIELL